MYVIQLKNSDILQRIIFKYGTIYFRESNDKKSVVIHRKLKTEKCEWTLNNSPSNQTEVS